MASKTWYKLKCKQKELQFLGTLNGGQSFRWKKVFNNNKEEWIGVFSKRLWILRRHEDDIVYQVFEKESENGENLKENQHFYNNLLSDYFQLNVNLIKLYDDWCSKDKYFKQVSSQFYGIRMLKQDLVENIFSFICSSNNNISRITGMVEKLASLFGDKICEFNNESYFDFPKVDLLAQDKVEAILKRESFGYRAKYVNQAAKIIVKGGGDDWLQDLKQLAYEEAKVKLMSLTGVGPKVADCICLMSLGHLQAIPIDTHVYQIARKLYMPNLPKQKSVTTKLYKEISENFQNIYGPLAGWAHTVILTKFTTIHFLHVNSKFELEKNKTPIYPKTQIYPPAIK